MATTMARYEVVILKGGEAVRKEFTYQSEARAYFYERIGFYIMMGWFTKASSVETHEWHGCLHDSPTVPNVLPVSLIMGPVGKAE